MRWETPVWVIKLGWHGLSSLGLRAWLERVSASWSGSDVRGATWALDPQQWMQEGTLAGPNAPLQHIKWHFTDWTVPVCQEREELPLFHSYYNPMFCFV